VTPLLLSAVSTSSSAVVAEWPKEPIAPNATGKITVTYNAQNLGEFTKTVAIVSNASVPQTVLTIHGEVKAAASPVSSSVPAAAPKTAVAPKKS
jgi:hypothetical protein